MSRLVIILSTRASEQEKYVRANNSGRAVRAWSIPHEYEYFSCHLLLFISDHLVFLDRKMINPVMPIAASEHSSNVLCQPFFHLQCPSHPVDCNSSFAPLFTIRPSVRPSSVRVISLPLNPGNETYPIRPDMSALSVFPTSLSFVVSGCEI